MIEIRGATQNLLIGGGTGYSYLFQRNSSTGFFEITGQQAGYTGFIFNTGYGSNAHTINDTGNSGFGVAIGSIAAKVHIVKTTLQQRIGYDASNYFDITVGSAGGVTFDAVGSGAGFTFSDAITGTTFNGVALTTGGSSTKYLSEDGTYTTPSGGGGGIDSWVIAHKNGTNQTITTATVTVVSWGTEVEDTDGDFASNTLTVATGERWDLNVQLQIDNMQGYPVETMIYKDGSLYRSLYRSGQWGSGNQDIGGHIILTEAGDYDVRVQQVYGIDRTLQGATTASYLTARRIK